MTSIWNWFISLFKKKELIAPICSLQMEANIALLPEEDKDLIKSLIKARQEVFEPILSDKHKKLIDDLIYTIVPRNFKEALLKKQDLFLIGAHEFHPTLKPDDWTVVKHYAIIKLNELNIVAKPSSSGDYISLYSEEILKSIKDFNISSRLQEEYIL